MNVVSLERQAQILSALVEGNSVRSTSRMSGAHVGTILNLSVRVGNGSAMLMDQTMHGLRCQRSEVDEIWAYVGMKQKQAATHPERRAQIGDFYGTWSETDASIGDLKSRLATRIQLTSDAFPAYYGAVSRAFENRVDYAQLQKVYASDVNWGRYSPPQMVNAIKEPLIGQPDRDLISTSYVEPKPDNANGDAPIYSLDERFQQEAGEPESSCRVTLRPLLFRAYSQDAEGHACDGGQRIRSIMVDDRASRGGLCLAN